MLSAIGVSATDSVAAEGLENNYGAWQITRGESLEFSCTIYFRLTGTASHGSDYSITPSTGGYVTVSSTTYDSTTGTYYTEGSVLFDNHVSAVTLQLIPYNDSAKEVQETAILQLTRYVCFQDDVQLSGSASITIQDNDNWTVSAAATDAVAKESHVDAPNYGVYTITRSGETDTTYSLNTRFQLTGTAFASNDYSIYTETGNLVSLSTSYDQTTQDPIYTGNVVIPAGQMSVTLELRPNNDAEKELAENVTLTMLPSYSELGNGAYTVTGSPVTIVIEDNDDWVVSAAATDNEAAECPLPAKNYGVYTITRANETDSTHSLSVSFQMTGTAALSDYSLYTSSGNTVNLSSQYDQTTQSTIYTGSVTIPAGQTSVELELRPNNDAEREQLETALLTLRPSYSEYGYGAYTLAASSSATVSIEDNDDWVVSVAAADNEAAECPLPEKNYGVYTITRANETDTTHSLSVSFQMTGSAALSDYSLFNSSGNTIYLSSSYDQTTQLTIYTGSVSIPAGQTSIALELRPNNDAEREELETVILTLRPSYSEYGYGAYTLSASSSSATISIEDNDQWSVAVTAINNTTEEEASNNTRIYKIERNDETDVSFPISVPFTMSGSATTADYSLHTSSGSSISLSPFWDQTTQTYVYSGYISIPADAFNVTVELRPIDDNYAESDETAIMTIQPSLYYEIDPDNGEADITIEETTVVTLTTLDDVALEPCTWIPGNERNGAFRLTVYTTEIDRSAITVQLNVAGTAIPGYNGSSGDYHLTKNPNGGSSSDIISVSNGLASLTLPGNQDVLDFYAMPNGDALFEIDENVVLALAQAYSGMQSNQAECVDDEVEAVYILQAPEFISGNDPSPPTNVNADSYVKYIDPEAKNIALFGGKEIKAAIPIGRTYCYAFYDSTTGNDSLTSDATTSPLLEIDPDSGKIKVLRPLADNEKSRSLTFQIKVYDSVYNKLYDTAPLTISPLEFNLIPYTPETIYIAPMEIPAELWKVNNVGIRRNTDYDNGGSLNDSQVIGSYSENDLIKVKLNFNSTPGITYSIRRDSANLKFWQSSTKSGGEYTFTNNECVLTSAGYIWVEYASQESANYTLTLVARDSETDSELFTEEMVFRPFNSVTCAFVGEFETAGSSATSPGINNWVEDQLLNGYDVHVWDDGHDILYDEYGNNIANGGMNDDCDQYGEGRAFDEIVNAVNNRGVTKVALVGYSHGGGSVANLAWRMKWDGQNPDSDPDSESEPLPDRITKSYSLVFTSYIVAVSNDFFLDPRNSNDVNERPLESQFHVNQYQTNDYPRGHSNPNADHDIDCSNLGVMHSSENSNISIDTNPTVVAFLTEQFRQKVTR